MKDENRLLNTILIVKKDEETIYSESVNGKEFTKEVCGKIYNEKDYRITNIFDTEYQLLIEEKHGKLLEEIKNLLKHEKEVLNLSKITMEQAKDEYTALGGLETYKSLVASNLSAAIKLYGFE